MANSTTHLVQITQSQSQHAATANELFDAASPAMLFGRNADASAALTWGFFGGVFTEPDGTLTPITNGTIALTASATNYLYATSAGVVTKATTEPAGWPSSLASNAKALYEIVAGASTVTSYTDWRTGGAGGGGGGDVDAAIAAHEASANPHPTYLTQAEADAMYASVSGGSETTTTLGALINGATAKTTPVDADLLPLADSEASFVVKKLTWANLKAGIFSAWGALVAAGTGKTTPVDGDSLAISDSAASGATKKLTWANLKATLKTYFDTLYAPASQPIIIGIFYPGAPTAGALLGTLTAPSGITTITFAAAISGSSGKALTAATAQTDIDVRKNAATISGGTSVGTVRFAASGTVPTFIAASGFTLTGGTDYLSLWGPASADATLANFEIALYGTRS